MKSSIERFGATLMVRFILGALAAKRRGGYMSRDDLFIQQKLMPVIGDVRAPGFEPRRVALEIAQQRVNNRVVHTGSPTGNPSEHGIPDTYRGLLPFASN